MRQIIYASIAVRTFQRNDIKKMLTKARKLNARNGISGMLVYHARTFLHVLEGPDVAADELFVRIQHDPRHVGVRLISDRTVAAKEFESWSLGFVGDIGTGPEVADFAALSPVTVLTLDTVRARLALQTFQRGAWRGLAYR